MSSVCSRSLCALLSSTISVANTDSSSSIFHFVPTSDRVARAGIWVSCVGFGRTWRAQRIILLAMRYPLECNGNCQHQTRQNCAVASEELDFVNLRADAAHSVKNTFPRPQQLQHSPRVLNCSRQTVNPLRWHASRSLLLRALVAYNGQS